MRNFCLQLAAIFALTVSISAPQLCLAEGEQLLRSFPCDGNQDVIDQERVHFDKDFSADGKGSLKIDAKEPCTIKLFEVQKLDLGTARLIYRAKLNLRDLKGKANIVMVIHFPNGHTQLCDGRSDFQKKQKLKSGWVATSSRRLIMKRMRPDSILLNIKIDGHGSVWIDDVTLSKKKVRFVVPVNIASQTSRHA